MIHHQELTGGPPKAGGFELRSVRDGGGFARLRREWGELLERSDAGVFNAWEWLYPWYRRLGAERRLMILLARDERGELAGLMPLGLSELRVAGGRVRRLAFLGETHVGSDYLDVVARRGLEDEVARAFARAIRDARGEWDVLDLLDLEQDSATVRAFSEVFSEAPFATRLSARFVCPFERFERGVGFDQFLRRTVRRDNFLRRRKYLTRQPGYSLEVATEPGALTRPLADFFRLHAARWAVEGGSQGIKGPSVEAFHRDATQLFAERGWLRMYTLRLDGAALASVYGIVHRGKFIYFQSGYDPTWRARSVGLVLVGETFREAIDAGLSEYDFLRGTEPYKADWTTLERKTVALRVWRWGGRGAWLNRQEDAARLFRQLAKRALPPDIVERVRRARRRWAQV